MTSPAPALDRGIAVMQALQNTSPLSLDELAREVRCPKSSLLRILDSLQRHGWVQRNTQKQYLPLLHMNPVKQMQDWDTLMAERLTDLGRRLDLTVEWYQIRDQAAVITWRFEPEWTPVHIRAQVGFIRTLQGEMEAVARVVLNTTSLKPGRKLWMHVNGEPTPLSVAQLKKMLQAMQSHVAIDTEYNNNGVRRMAAGILNPNGTLKGIIALAEGFTPKADQLRSQRLEALEATATHLEACLQKEPL